MATPADADIVLKLYDLRREQTMRAARNFMGMEFNPQTVEEFSAIHQPSHPQNAYWRQVVSFWEMACTLALHGSVDTELFAETQGEAFFIRAKFAELSEAATGNPFMPKTKMLIEKSPAAKQRFEGLQKMLAARKAAAPAK